MSWSLPSVEEVPLCNATSDAVLLPLLWLLRSLHRGVLLQ